MEARITLTTLEHVPDAIGEAVCFVTRFNTCNTSNNTGIHPKITEELKFSLDLGRFIYLFSSEASVIDGKYVSVTSN